MRQYETTFIVAPALSDGEIKQAAESYEKLLKKEGCEIVHVNRIGLQQLAYPIKRHNSGVYYSIEYSAKSGEVIDKVELAFRRDERILRFLSVKLDKYGIKYNEDKRSGVIDKRKKELADARAKERAEIEASNKIKKAENRKKQALRNAPVEVPAEKVAPPVEVPAEKVAPTVEVPAEKVAPTVEVPAEKVAPTVEVPAEKVAPTVEVPAEKVAPTVEVPAEKAAPIETVDTTMDIAEEVSLDMDILGDLTDI